MFKKRSRFTLIELIVVIAVMGILSSIVIPNIKDVREKAEVAAVKSNIRNIQTAVDMYKLDKDSYPTDKQPEFIEDKDNMKNTSGFLVEKEPINFEKDNFVTDYLRKEPTDGHTYYVDAWGIVSVDSNLEGGGEGNETPKPEIPQTKEKIRIIAGNSHSFALVDTGEVYSWGNNVNGQLGLGHQIKQNTPQLVTFFADKKVKDIILGNTHSFALLETGEVYSWGNNTNGSLGLGNKINQDTPQLVTAFNGKKVKKIELGLHSFAILENGEIYGWGYNSDGELGLGNKIDQDTPQLVTFFNDKKVKDIRLGKYNTIALLENGEVYSFGYNSYGELGLGHKTGKDTPQLITELSGKKVKEISTGHHHSFAILENGEVYGWGRNNSGQLGVGDNIDKETPQLITFFNDHKLKEIKLGGGHSFAILENGKVYGWGKNTYGQLGIGNKIDQVEPQLLTFFNDKEVRHTSLGGDITFMILEDGQVYGCGYNLDGQLGLEYDTLENLVPTLSNFFK